MRDAMSSVLFMLLSAVVLMSVSNADRPEKKMGKVTVSLTAKDKIILEPEVEPETAPKTSETSEAGPRTEPGTEEAPVTSEGAADGTAGGEGTAATPPEGPGASAESYYSESDAAGKELRTKAEEVAAQIPTLQDSADKAVGSGDAFGKNVKIFDAGKEQLKANVPVFNGIVHVHEHNKAVGIREAVKKVGGTLLDAADAESGHDGENVDGSGDSKVDSTASTAPAATAPTASTKDKVSSTALTAPKDKKTKNK